jgi:RNA polymerase sigma-70 factor (ECF subfamily)
VDKGDIALIKRARKGNSEASAQLIKKYLTFIAFYSERFLYDKNQLDDAMQEIAITLYTKLGGLKEPRAFPGWLYRIIKNRCHLFNVKTMEQREREYALPDLPYAEPLETAGEYIPEESLEGTELDSEILTAISHLPEKQQLAIRLYYYEDLSYQEIAERLGIDVRSVGSNLTRAKKTMKEMIEHKKEKDDITIRGVSAATAIPHALIVGEVGRMFPAEKLLHFEQICTNAAPHAGGQAAVTAGAGKLAATAVAAKGLITTVILSVAIGGAALAVSVPAVQQYLDKEPLAMAEEPAGKPSGVSLPDAEIVLTSSEEGRAGQHNPVSARLLTDGTAAEWTIAGEDGTAVVQGAGGEISAELTELSPGTYSIRWNVTGEGGRSIGIAVREFTIGESEPMDEP